MRYNKQWGFSDSIRNLVIRFNFLGFFNFVSDVINSLFVLLKFFLFSILILPLNFCLSLLYLVIFPFNLANIALSLSPLFYNEITYYFKILYMSLT